MGSSSVSPGPSPHYPSTRGLKLPIYLFYPGALVRLNSALYECKECTISENDLCIVLEVDEMRWAVAVLTKQGIARNVFEAIFRLEE